MMMMMMMICVHLAQLSQPVGKYMHNKTRRPPYPGSSPTYCMLSIPQEEEKNVSSSVPPHRRLLLPVAIIHTVPQAACCYTHVGPSKTKVSSPKNITKRSALFRWYLDPIAPSVHTSKESVMKEAKKW